MPIFFVANKNIINKVTEWLYRYGPAEAVATFGGYMVAVFGNYSDYNTLAVSYVASWTDGVTYYIANFVREFFHSRKTKPEYSLSKACYKSVRNCVVEFGPAHALNAFFFQPWGIYVATKYSHNVTFGFFIGTLISEGGFYFLVICAYELRKRYLAD